MLDLLERVTAFRPTLLAPLPLDTRPASVLDQAADWDGSDMAGRRNGLR